MVIIASTNADVAELADAQDLKSALVKNNKPKKYKIQEILLVKRLLVFLFFFKVA